MFDKFSGENAFDFPNLTSLNHKSIENSFSIFGFVRLSETRKTFDILFYLAYQFVMFVCRFGIK